VKGPTLRQTAWHEAGHAVAAWERGLAVTLVSIRRIGDCHGRSQHTPAGDCSIPSEREREAIVAMAGWAAELASGEVKDGITYDSGDLSWVLSRIDEYAPTKVAIELGWAQSEAQRIISANLDRIERLANALLHRVELVDASEIMKLIEGQRPNREDLCAV
jgi:ATP-dependent Zn protease